jgi:hypothetical protein
VDERQPAVGDAVEFVDHLDRDGRAVWRPGRITGRVGDATGRPLWLIEDSAGERRTRTPAEVRPPSGGR